LFHLLKTASKPKPVFKLNWRAASKFNQMHIVRPDPASSVVEFHVAWVSEDVSDTGSKPTTDDRTFPPLRLETEEAAFAAYAFATECLERGWC